MNLEAELDDFALDIVQDVYEYVKQNICNDFEGRGYKDPRSSLYSRFGQLTIIQYLNDTISKEEFFARLTDPRLPGIDDIDNLFDNTVAAIIAESEDGHAAFYETCASIVVSGIFAMKNGSFTKSKIYKAIVEYARPAQYSFSLDPNYDGVRIEAHSFLYAFYHIFGENIIPYFTPIDIAIGVPLVRPPERHIYFVCRNLPLSNRGIKAFLSGSLVDDATFFKLVGMFLKGFLLDPDIRMSNSLDNLSRLIFYFCFISVHYPIHGFENAIRNTIDIIVQLMIMERNHHIIRSLSSDSREQ